MELKIDEQLRNVLIPLSEEKKVELEKSLLQYGCIAPIITWNGVIVDGHNRYEICQKHGIPFEVTEQSFQDMLEARLWIMTSNNNQREACTFEKCEMAMQFRDDIQTAAFQRKLAGKNLPLLVGEGAHDRETPSILGNLAGVKRETMRMAMKLSDEADEELLIELRSGKIDIKPAYNKLTGKGKKASSPEPVLEARMPAPPKDETASDKLPANMEMIGKKAVHIEGKMPDVPESFPTVQDLVGYVYENCVVSLEHIVKQYTSGMVTEENNKELLDMTNSVCKEIRKIIKDRIEEVSK